jgi:hypothetical protein
MKKPKGERRNDRSSRTLILILLEGEHGIISHDLLEFFDNISLDCASGILLRLRRHYYVRRVKEIQRQGGIRYRYFITPNGINRLRWLFSDS